MKDKKPHRLKRRRQNLTGWLFVAPSLIVFTIFLFIPIVMGLVLSFTDYTGLTFNMSFVGFKNYINMFDDRYFMTSIKNNIIYSIIFTPATLLLALALATLLNSIKRLKKLFRTIFFLPYISSMVAVAVIWRLIFNPLGGPLNTILEGIGIQNLPQWLVSPDHALYAVIVVAVWKNCGYYMLIFLAGLQTIDTALYESAALDGANFFQRYTRITLPMLSPTIFLNCIITVIASFQVFDIVSIMTDGGPGMSTNVLVYRIYYEGFKNAHMGYASAIAYFLFAIILVITLVQFAMEKRWVQYD